MAADISNQLTGAVEELGRFKDSLETANIRMGNSASIEAKISRLEAEKAAILEKANKAETKRMKNLSSGMGKAAKSMGSLAMKLGVVGGILTMFKGVVDVLLKVDRHAAKFAKQMGMTRKSTERLFQDTLSIEGSFTSMGLSLGDALKTSGALAQEFGQISRITKDMVVQTGQFAKAFGVSTESAAQLTEHLTRAGVGVEYVEKGLKKAYISGNNLGVVARDLTKNAGMIELYLSRGDDSILDMANKAASLGKSLESFGKMSEAWSDVETIGENIGRTAQLLGPAFEDGLGDLTELYTMYQNFQDVELHERITEQLAKTMTMEKGILISRQTGAALTRAQIEQAAKLYGGDTEFMLRSIKYEKDYQAFQTAKVSQTLALGKLSRDEFGALQDAAREVANTEEHGFKEGVDLLTVQSTQQERLLKLAKERLAERKAEADVEANLKKILTDAMGVFEQIMSMVNTIMEPIKTAISTIFDEAFMKDFRGKLEEWGGIIKGIFSGEGDGAFNMQKIADKVVAKDGGIVAAFELLSTQIRTGFLNAFKLKTEDGTTLVGESSTWGDVIKSIIDTYIKPPMREFIDWMAKEVFGALGEGYDRWKQATPWADILLPDTETEDMRERLADLQTAVAGDWLNTYDLDALWVGLGGDKTAALEEIADLKNKLGLTTEPLLTDPVNLLPGSAKGWAGAAHRGIVGEAGTEVGISRNALRELSSAGIPGYQDGFGLTRRTEYAGHEASVGARANRHRDRQIEVDAYQGPMRAFLDRQEQENQDERNIWARDRKQFFVDFPAAIDRAIGEPFRQGGPIATGIYNSMFSGLQAGTRAELAGADKDKQRQLMYQHMTAEGLKPGGIINQGLTKLNAMQSETQRAYDSSLKDAQDREAALRDRHHAESVAMEIEWQKGADRDQEKIKLLRESRAATLKAIEVQEKTVAELEEIKANADVATRAQVGLLGGIQSGMQMMSSVIAAGGTKGQAWDMGKRAGIGGIVRDLTGTFGAADPQFLSTMNTIGMLIGATPLPSGAGRNTGEILNEAMRRTESTFQRQGYGSQSGVIGAASGRVFTSPHLAMVGEGSQNEVVIPTERIRKGLPINAGVARELGSIGVPGYWKGGPSAAAPGLDSGGSGNSWHSGLTSRMSRPDWMKFGATQGVEGGTATGMIGFRGLYEGGKQFEGGRMAAAGANLKSGAGIGMATAGMQFAQTYMQTGDAGAAAGQALGAGIGMAATAGLTPFLGPFAPMVGGVIGSLAGGALAKKFGYKPKYKKYRNRALKNLEEHVLTQGQFTHGQPGGIRQQLLKALAGGKKEHPTDKAADKLFTAVGGSKILKPGFMSGGSAEELIWLLSGQSGNVQEENALYDKYNQAFYGTPMASGGIVTRPTSAVIGERGPEAVIPLGQHGGYQSREQQEDQKNMLSELKKQNQTMQTFIKEIANRKIVMNVDGRNLAEAVGQGMQAIGNGE